MELKATEGVGFQGFGANIEMHSTRIEVLPKRVDHYIAVVQQAPPPKPLTEDSRFPPYAKTCHHVAVVLYCNFRS